MKKTVAIIVMLVMIFAMTALAAEKAAVSGELTSTSQIKDDELYYGELDANMAEAMMFDMDKCKDLINQLPKLSSNYYFFATTKFDGLTYYMFAEYEDEDGDAKFDGGWDLEIVPKQAVDLIIDQCKEFNVTCYAVYKEVPQTGDNTPVMLLGGLMLLGLVGMAAAKRKAA